MNNGPKKDDGKTPDAQPKRRKSLLWRFCRFVIVLTALAGLAFFFGAEPAIKHFVLKGLKQQGFKSVHIGKAFVTRDAVHLQDVRLGDDGTIEHVRIGGYIEDWRNLNVTLEKPELALRIEGDVLHVAGASFSLEPGGAGRRLPVLPVVRVTAHGATIRVTALENTLTLQGKLEAAKAPKPGEFAIRGDVRALHGMAAADARLSGNFDMDGRYEILAELSGVELKHALANGKRMSGWLSLRNNDNDEGRLRIGGEAVAGALTILGLPFSDVSMTFNSDLDEHQLIMSGGAGRQAATLSADLRVTTHDDVLRVDATADAEVKDLATALQHARKAGDMADMPDLQGTARIGVKIEGEKPLFDALPVESGWTSFAGTVDYDVENVTYAALATDLATSGSWSFASTGNAIELSTTAPLQLTGTLSGAPRPFAAELPASKDKPLALSWADDGTATLSAPSGLKWQGANASLDFRGAITAKRAREDAAGIDLSARNASVVLSSHDLRADGTDIDVRVSGVEGMSLEGAVKIDTLGSTLKSPPFTPFSADISGNTDKGVLRFKGDLKHKTTGIVLPVTGRHAFDGGRGSGTVRMRETAFSATGFQPGDILPELSKHEVTVTGGRIGLNVDIAWDFEPGRNPVSASGDILVKNLSGDRNEISWQGVNGVVAFNTARKRIVRDQEIAIGVLDAGLPLTGGLVKFSYERPTQTLFVSESSWDVANGRILTGPFDMQLDDPRASVTLTAQSLDLGALFKLAALEGLDVTGSVSGALPLRITPREIEIIDGKLEAETPGSILYSIDAMPEFLKNPDNPNVKHLRTALQNFDYESLSLNISAESGQTQTIRLKARGTNEEFYGGAPVEINLNLEGALQNVLKYNLGAYQLPETIQKHIEEYEKRHGK